MHNLSRIAVLLLLGLASAAHGRAAALEIPDDSRVVFLGDTFIERAQEYGHLELAMLSAFPNHNLTFRNLGWSADTTRGQSRASFDHLKPEQGWTHLMDAIEQTQPDVVILGYGMAESFRGADYLDEFVANYEALLDSIQETASDRRIEFALLGPIAHERLPAPAPDPEAHNVLLEKYTNAIAEIAARRNAPFVNLYEITSRLQDAKRLTDNGIHLSETGYRDVSRRIAMALGGGVPPMRFDVPFNEAVESTITPSPTQLIVESGDLDPGDYTLEIDGESIVTASAEDWRDGVEIPRGGPIDDMESLRTTIVEKNELFFHRWRPQNSTYLFLFRKHEQGQNAAEIPLFDPLIQSKEAEIHNRAKAQPHTYRLVNVSDADPIKTPIVEPHEYDFGTPEQALPEFQLGDNLEISLYAQNPLLAKPIQINFDAEGRLWVASSEVYPQIEPGQEANDKILILEDTNGDHVADRSTVFADGLLIPTGVVPGDGGAYVGQSTQLLHFVDHDNDGRADEKRIVLSGFGTEDTHHILHTLRWGFDGRLYMNQSIYIHSHVETPHGVRRLNSGGVWRLDPESLELEVLLKGFCNPWGHHFNEYGQSFVTDGAGFQGLSVGVPGAMYFTYAGAPRTIDSISPGSYPKFCGLELINSPAFPDEWQGDAITCDFRAHRITRFEIDRKDSSYITTQADDLARTTESTFRPIDIKTGPDGALYVADWSNPIIQHGEVDFRDERRDHTHGRIWRIAYKGETTPPQTDLPSLSNEELLNTLLSNSQYHREQSKRLLQERGDRVLPTLGRWTEAHAGNDRATLEALWMYDALRAYRSDLLNPLLGSAKESIRAAAVRSIANNLEHVDSPSAMLARTIKDSGPQVRLETVRALSKLGSAEALALALQALDHPMDNHLDYALWLTANDLSAPFTNAISQGDWPVAQRKEETLFALQALPRAEASKALNHALAEIDLSGTNSNPWIGLIGKAGNQNALTQIYNRALDDDTSENDVRTILSALLEAATVRSARPSSELDEITEFFKSEDDAIRDAAIQLAAKWNLGDSAFKSLEKIAMDSMAVPDQRSAALNAMADLNTRRAAPTLEKIARSDDDYDNLRILSATRLAAFDLETGAEIALDVIRTLKDESQLANAWRRLLAVQNAAGEITRHLTDGALSEQVAQTGIRIAREGGRSEPDLVIALSRAANLEATMRKLTPAEMKAIAQDAETSGDPYRGESVYNRPELACVACHAIGGIGAQVGPDMTSIGASAPTDYLVESLTDPNAKIKEGYHAIQIVAKDGSVYAGTLAREDSEQVFLRNAAGQIQPISKSQIDSRVLSDFSLMPAGLIDRLPRQDRLDLYAFLSKLGEPGDFDASRANIARVWRLFPETIDAAQFGEEKILSTPFSEAANWRGGWRRATTRVNGALSRESIEQPLKQTASRAPKSVYAATEFELGADQTIELLIEGARHAQVWLGTQSIEPKIDATGRARIRQSLSAGTHRLTIKIPANKLPDLLRVQSSEGQFSIE